MVYTTGIPAATDLISDSQSDILGNFNAIKTLVDVNHVTFDVADQGKHKFVEMPNQGSDPAGALTEFTLFSKLAGGNSQLHYKRDNAGSSFQLSARDPAGTTNGTTFLPGGFELIWGANAAVVNNTDTPFHTAFSNNCFWFMAVSNSATDIIPIAVQSFDETNFKIKFTAGGNLPILYVAIGN